MHACNYDAFRCFLPLFVIFFGGFSSFLCSLRTHQKPREIWIRIGREKKKKEKDQIITQGDSQAFSDDAHRQFVVISTRFWPLFLVKHPKKTTGTAFEAHGKCRKNMIFYIPLPSFARKWR
jgi:hypothetical protein